MPLVPHLKGSVCKTCTQSRSVTLAGSRPRRRSTSVSQVPCDDFRRIAAVRIRYNPPIYEIGRKENP
jgi:hypothetical protein